jgi:stearoyl-CoA desaturase (delta-9 desaturase)
MIIIIFFIAHWYLSLFAQSFYLHRYLSHRMFEIHTKWKKFFHFFCYFSQGSFYLIPRVYVLMHRMHHAYSDTEKDPHAPGYFTTIIKLMVNMKKRFFFLKHYEEALATASLEQTIVKYLDTPESKKWIADVGRIEAQYLDKLPAMTSLDTWADSWFSRLMWGAIYSIPYLFFADPWWLWCFYPLHFILGPIQGSIVNWAGHKIGYKNFNNGDDSRNTLFWDIFLLGELYQNNHHHFPGRAKFAFKKWELDPLYPIILFLKKIKIINSLT